MNSLRVVISFVVAVVLIAATFYVYGLWYEATRVKVIGHEPGFVIDEEVFLPPLEPFVKPTIEGQPDFLQAMPIKYDKRITTLVRTTGAYCGFTKTNFYCYYGSSCNTSRHCSHPGQFIE